MIHFSSLDATVLILFCVLIAAIGSLTKLKKSTFVEYLVAGRSLTMPAMVATLVSTWYGGVLGVGESVSYYGVGTWILLGVPYYVFATIYSIFYAGKVRERDALSIPQRLESRWNRNVALTGAILIFLLATPAANVYMMGVLVHLLTGIPTTLAVLLSGLLGALFLVRAGLVADVRVGIIAFLAVYIGFFVIDAVCLSHQSLSSAIQALPSSNLKKWDGGQGILAVLSFFVLGAWTLVDPGFHQRVTSSANPNIAKKGVLVATGFFFLSDILTITAGIFAIDKLRPLPENHVAIFPIFADQVLPNGLKAIFFVGLIGVTVSSLVGYTLVGGATLGKEIGGRIGNKNSDKASTILTRWGLLITSLLAVGIALWVHSVLTIWYTWSGVLIGNLLIPVSFSYFHTDRLNLTSTSIISGMVAGFVTSLSWMIYGMNTNNPELNVTFLGQSFSLGTLVPAVVASGIVTFGIARSSPVGPKIASDQT